MVEGYTVPTIFQHEIKNRFEYAKYLLIKSSLEIIEH